MLVLLLLVTRVAGEWVEISQHYRSGEPSHKVLPGYRGPAEPDKIYANYSLTERSWPKSDLSRITNIGSVRRVHLRGKDKVTLGGHSEGTHARPTTIEMGYESIGSVKAPNMKNGNIEIDAVKTQLSTDRFGTVNGNHVRSHPFLYSDSEIGKSTLKAPELLNTSNHGIEKNKYEEIVINDGEYNKEAKSTIKSYGITPDAIHVRRGSNIGLSNDIVIAKNPFVNLKQYSEESENKVKYTSGGRTRNTAVTNKITNKTFPEDYKSPAHTLHPATVTVEHNIGNDLDKGFDSKITTVRNIEMPNSQQRLKEKADNFEDIDTKLSKAKDVNKDSGKKTNTAQVIWKLMKIVTDNISRNTRRSFRSKIKYLEDLQNNIVSNIAERVEQAWPDDEAAGGRRARRRRATARGHVEFPSSESALMTISFLTFAVFLIKLVLVIHTYKNKTMMVTPAVVAAVGRAAAAAALDKQIHP